VDYKRKSDSTPVTVADTEAEATIRRAIEAEFPGEAVLGEEQGGSGAPDRWVIDPIDGTKSFICGVPLYATLLSYEQDGVPILGVCAFPALGEVVYAERGTGCFWNDRPCRVSTKARIEDSVLSCGSHASMAAHGRAEPFQRLAARALATRTWTDAYGHALVATGRIEAMLDPVISRWDISAMAVIVREAGGSFTDFQGNEVLSDEAVSCAPGVKESVLGAFRP
jgi:histidinol phosphatase-like enzyme (inositol monophosphatase family)